MSEHKDFDLDELLEIAKSAATEGRRVLLDYFGRLSQVNEKTLAGLVTEADLESEKAIRAYLAQHTPNCDFLGEEQSFIEQNQSPGSESSERGLWIVDPLDGTTNYVHQFPVFCVSIGFQYKGELIVGVVDAPKLDQVFSARKGGGAYLNGEPIQVSQRPTLSESLLATGFFAQNKAALKEQLKVFSCLVGEARGVRRAGAAAYDLCMVAQGVFDAFWEKNLKPWDTAGGTVIVREAGGTVSTYDGAPYNVHCNSLIAANPNIYPHVLHCVQDALVK